MKLLDRVAETAARRHMSPLTVECYQRWIREFLLYWAAPREKGEGRQERGDKDGVVHDNGAGESPATAGDEVAGDQAAAHMDIAAGLLLDEPAGEIDIAAGLLLDEPEAPKPGRVWRHPRELGAAEVAAFLTALAVERRLSASSQNQATNAIVFLYKHVLAA
jgi:hypothetical protein